jgi:hypothetical protein
MAKQESGFKDSLQNVVGCAVDADPLYIYIDLAMGKNQPWLGGDGPPRWPMAGWRTIGTPASTSMSDSISELPALR